MPLQFTPRVTEECARFFFSFSRIESALKEIDCWKVQNGGVAPDWNTFTVGHEADYALSAAGAELLRLEPKRQVAVDGLLAWQPLTFDDGVSDLKKVITALKTVRNNLFHGGKTGRDQEQRTLDLMQIGIAVIEELASLDGGPGSDLYANYHGNY